MLMKSEIYKGGSPEPHTSLENTFPKRVSAFLSEEDKVLLRDNGDRFCLLHDLGIPERYDAPVLQKITSVAASARGSRMPIVADMMLMVKRVIRMPTNQDLEFSSDEDETDDDMILLHSIETYEPKPIPLRNIPFELWRRFAFKEGQTRFKNVKFAWKSFKLFQ